MVQYDLIEIYPSDNRSTGILVIIDHLRKQSHAITKITMQPQPQIYYCRNGLPVKIRLHRCNQTMPPNLTSTAGHPRTQAVVERRNGTLLTLLRVLCSQGMRDWDLHLDEVMGAYNSTRHAISGFSSYMLIRGTEKAIPLTYLHPDFATESFESHEAYVEHIITRQQEIHDLVRRNAHQAQRRQKLKYDENYRAKVHSVGEHVWVFCCHFPQKGMPKPMRAWRGPPRYHESYKKDVYTTLTQDQRCISND